MGKSSISLFSALLVISVLWKPAHSNDCSIKCEESATSPFAAGQRYSFGVESAVDILAAGADPAQTGVKLLGQVTVTALGGCRHELSVASLAVSGPDGKKHGAPAGLALPVQFSLAGGRLGAQLCAAPADSRRSLNIKRALISLLQTDTTANTQVDVFGACPTESARAGALVHRARDLARCAHREQPRAGLAASVLNPAAEIKESQILQSTLNIESKVNNDIPEKVSATEEYVYRPFAGDSGARARVHTKLTLTGKAAAGPAGQCTVPRSIIFENPHGAAALAGNLPAALQAVKDTARSVGPEASEKSAGSFAQLIRIFRSTSKEDLLKVYNQVKGNQLEKRVFLDGLLRAGSGEAVEAGAALLRSAQLDPLEAQLYYVSLGNARHVSDEALKAVTSLLDQPEVSKQLYLGAGALAGAYCRQHGCGAGARSPAAAALGQKLAAKLGNCRQKNKLDEDKVVAILKGIRNIGHLEGSLADKLAHVAQDGAVRARVRAAALEAFTADPCNAKIKKTAMDVLKNRNLDSELRIRGYLAVLACPCARSAGELRALLDSEPVHQVGRFITSSLRAVRASANPDRRLARLHYGQIGLPTRFKIDDRKFSFFREQSFNVDALGVGGVAEETVIFSQDSFLPRAAALNLTAELFGHSFNVLELGGRQGNLDLVLEHFFGPRGVLRTKSAQELYDAVAESFAAGGQRAKEALNRGRRSVKTEIDAFDKNLKAEATAFDNELDLDLYVKVFGTDAVFLSLGDSKGFDFDDAVSQLIAMLSGAADQAKKFSRELRAHLLFLDAELAYPTASGLPLRLQLTGAAAARLELASDLDLAACLRSPQTARLDVRLVPSADLELSAVLLVDADAVSTGLKVVSNLHSSTGVHVVAKVLENGRGFDVQLGLPVDKQEIIVATNDVVYFTAEKGQKEKQTKIKVDADRNKEYAACFDQLSEALGLTLCGEVSLPFAVNGPENQASFAKYLTRYPITGISKLKIVLEKNDLKGYHFRGLVREEGGKTSFELLLDAEGSKNRRTQLTGESVYTENEVGLKLALDWPLSKLSGELSARRSDAELAAVVRARMDEQEYFLHAALAVSGGGARTAYRPALRYRLPGQEPQAAQLEGQVLREQRGALTRYSLEGLRLRLPGAQDPVGVEGFFQSQAGARDAAFELVTDYVTLKGGLKGADLQLEFMNQLNPLVNFILKGHSEFGDVIKNEFDIIHSGDCKDRSKRVIFSQYLKYSVDKPETTNIITKNKFEIVSLPFKLVVDADVEPRKLEAALRLAAPAHSAAAELRARTHIKKPDDYSFKLLLSADKRELEVFSKRDIVNADKSNFENYISLKGVAKYELSGVVHHKNTPKETHVGAVGHLKVTYGKTEDIKFNVGVEQTPQLFSSHATISSDRELLDYLLKVTRGAAPAGELRLVLADAVAARGQFKLTEADGKGNGMLIVDFKKSQRKLKADVKFVAHEPVFSADVDLFLNYEKDNSDKLSFSTDNKITDKLFNSKNKFEYGGKRTELVVHKDGEFGSAAGGQTHANIELVLPTQRCLTFRVDRDVTLKDGVYNGVASVALSDAARRGAPGASLSYRGKLANTNFDAETVDYEGQLRLQLADGKALQNSFTFKNVPHDGKYKFDFTSELSGELMPKPASLAASATYLGEPTRADDIYNIKASYGDDIALDYGGVFVVQFGEGQESKYVDDYTVSLRLPVEQARTLKFTSTVVVQQPAAADSVEYRVVESLQVNDATYKLDASGRAGRGAGAGSVRLLLPRAEPFVLDGSYKHAQDKERTSSSVELKARYDRGRSLAVSAAASAGALGQTLVLKAHAPHLEGLKELEVTVHSKNPAPDTYSSSVVVSADGRVYRSASNVVLSKANPVLDLQYSSPSNPKTSKIYVKGTSLSSTQGKLEVKVENVRAVSLALVSEASVQKDNVEFTAQADSDELKLHVAGRVASRDAPGGRRLELLYTSDGKDLIRGSTSYISKQEGPKTIIEGSGSVKFAEEQKSASFKYIRTILTEGSEKGVETFFKVALGERSYVAESKVTNLEFKNSHVYCEEKKQCANAELQAKLDLSKPGVVRNVVVAALDLRPLGVAPELGLHVEDEVSAGAPRYSLDLHANKEGRKYHLRVYSTPAADEWKAGVRVSLPGRTLLLEQELRGAGRGEGRGEGRAGARGALVLDLHEGRRGHRAAARFNLDLDVASDRRQTALAEFGFSHPSLDKEALFKVQGVAVRSGDNSIKIETTAVLAHSCLGRDREGKILFEASPNNFKFFIQSPLVSVLELEGSGSAAERAQRGELRARLLEGPAVRVEASASDYRRFELTTGYIAEGDRKLSVVARIDPEKRVDFSADILLSGQKKNIAHGGLFLENDLVKSDYGVSKENAEYFLTALRKDLDALGGRMRQLEEKALADLEDVTKRAQPTLQKLQKAYEDDFNQIYKEIVDDKVLQDLSQAISDIASYLAKFIDEVVKATKPLIETYQQIFVETVNKIREVYTKQVAPELKKVADTVGTLLKEYFDGVLEIVAHATALVNDFYEKHKPELEELTNTIAEIFKDVTRLLVAQLKEFRVQAAAALEELANSIKDLPVFTALKERLEELSVPEQLQVIPEQLHEALRPLLPTPEAQQFADALKDYVLKKMRKEKCDDNKELRALYARLLAAAGSLLRLLRDHAAPPALADPAAAFSAPSWLSGSGPRFGGEAAFSSIRQLLSGELPSLAEILREYRPRSLDLFDEIPAKLRGVVVDGQHVFTFDGRHLTFPGTCRYVLAHDHVDRNFTLLLQLAQGRPKALVLEDKSGHIIELKDNGQVTLNGANHGFPVELGEAFAFREVNGRIGLGSKYGLMAFCTAKLEVCYVEVSGFYLGKLRGLLGDGNNEPYDDFRLPNGKICSSESEFGNAYRLARSCAAATAPAHTAEQARAPLPEPCERVLGGASPLRPLQLFLDVAPFRQACAHAAAHAQEPARALAAACGLARGYAALAATGLLPAALPDACLACADADRPRALGDTYEYRLPAKQADIIAVVETTKSNEKNFKSLVVPLVSQLVDSLKAKKFTDIKVYLVGITSKFPYPVLFDTDLKLKNAKITFDDASRYSAAPALRTGHEAADDWLRRGAELLRQLRIALGADTVDASYMRVMELPFRAGAVKMAINLVGDRCEHEDYLLNAFKAGFFGEMMDNMGMTLSLVTDTAGLELGGGKPAAQVVGFDEQRVLLLGDKKLGADSAPLRRTLAHAPSSCIDYTENAGGAVFSASNFHALAPAQQKQFLQTAAAAVAQRALRDQLTQTCACARSADPFRARSVCVNKARKEAVPARRRK